MKNVALVLVALLIATPCFAWNATGHKAIALIAYQQLAPATIGPKLEEAGLGWVNFQVMRRTHSTLMNQLKVDPKLVADQLGHTLDVNQNVYTVPDIGLRREAVNQLENALQIA